MPFITRQKVIKPIISIISFLLIIESIMMLLCIPFSIYYGEDIWPLAASAFITFVTGFCFWMPRRGFSGDLGKKGGFLVVTLSWVAMSLFGMLPFLFCPQYANITDAFFESMSGFTTTGATVLEQVESVPAGILFWRSMTHWIGGMGIIMLTLAILPILGIAGFHLFAAEATGPQKSKLHPKIKVTAKRLWIIYLGLTTLETILLLLGDMNFFESICHSFATMSTGGFSTRTASMAAFSPYSQYIVTIFMTLGGINFTIIYFLFKKLFKKIIENHELWAYLIILFVSALLVSFGLIFDLKMSVEEGWRHAIFQVVSVMTTTGFMTSDFALWPYYSIMILFILMFIGGMAGSTSGGIKVIRQCLLVKNSYLELKRLIHPNAVIPLTFSKKIIDHETQYKVMAFFLLYIIVFLLSCLTLSIMGLDFQTSFGAAASCIGNIGPGLGTLGPASNYGHIPCMAKWFLAFLMLLGRLELFTVLVIFTPNFWKR